MSFSYHLAEASSWLIGKYACPPATILVRSESLSSSPSGIDDMPPLLKAATMFFVCYHTAVLNGDMSAVRLSRNHGYHYRMSTYLLAPGSSH